MANVFNDPHCVAVYDGDTWLTLGKDSKNSQDFTYYPFPNTTDTQEGDACAEFERDKCGELSLDDSALSADFPGKSGTGNTTFSMVAWVKFESVPVLWLMLIVGKPTGISGSWLVEYYPSHIRGGIYNAGCKWIDHASAVVAGRWYHVGATYDGSDRSYRVRIWDDTLGAILGINKTGTADKTMAVGTSPLRMGGNNQQGSLDGLVDDVAVFNDVLSADEIDSCRSGTYDYGGDPDCVAHWSLDSTDFVTDDIGANNWTSSPGLLLNTTDYKVGTASWEHDYWVYAACERADADLMDGYPLKSTDATKKISVCCWLRWVGTDNTCILYKGTDVPLDYTWRLHRDVGGNVVMSIGYDGGAKYEAKFATGPALVSGQWYHLGATYDDADKSYRLRIWDDTASTVTDSTGNFSHDIWLSTTPWQLGAGYATGWKGQFDELVLFNDILTADEIDRIRQGTYGAVTWKDLAGSVAATSSASANLAQVHSLGGTVAVVSTVAGRTQIKLGPGHYAGIAMQGPFPVPLRFNYAPTPAGFREWARDFCTWLELTYRAIHREIFELSRRKASRTSAGWR